MLKELFKPISIKNNLYHFKIGYQNIIVLEINQFKNCIIVDKMLKELFSSGIEVFFFKSLIEMEEELEPLITYTTDDFLVIIN